MSLGSKLAFPRYFGGFPSSSSSEAVIKFLQCALGPNNFVQDGFFLGLGWSGFGGAPLFQAGQTASSSSSDATSVRDAKSKEPRTSCCCKRRGENGDDEEIAKAKKKKKISDGLFGHAAVVCSWLPLSCLSRTRERLSCAV